MTRHAVPLVNLSRRGLLGAMSLGSIAGCAPPRDELAKITGGFTGTSIERGHLLRQSALPAYSDDSVKKVHTLIAGGGVAGLSAARAMRLQGMEDFALLELEDVAGGNSRGAQLAGMAHPLGAHYLPVPNDDAPEVQDFLEELGLRKRIAGRWQYDEVALCHSPQERLYFNGAWQDGLLPTQGISTQTQLQYERFAKLVQRWCEMGAFRIPVRPLSDPFLRQKRQLAGMEFAPNAMIFIAYLDQEQLTDPYLRWYLDYCCRDDYGAGINTVSAWAGIHYFAARHGFSAPGDGGTEREGVLTWPQGNAFLTQALAKPLGERLHTAQVILRIEEQRGGVVVDALDTASGQVRRWLCDKCIVALPLHVAARVVAQPPAFLQQAARQVVHSSWWVANIHINAPLHDDARGAHPSWDNVIYGGAGLGYVDAMHQSTRPVPGATVLTYYHAAGAGLQVRQTLQQMSWSQLRDQALAEISQAHPDITRLAQQINITRYGHAMAVPTPASTTYFLSQIGTSPAKNLRGVLSKKERINHYPHISTPATARLRFAHSDWSGYSVLEEAFTRGLHAAL